MCLVYEDGEVCISILHEPGEDKFGYEKASERWSPVHTVESVVLSVISMLSDPNPESAANVLAAVSIADTLIPISCLNKEMSIYGLIGADHAGIEVEA